MYEQGVRVIGIDAWMSALPPTGFTVACSALKIQRAGAAPAHVVAILEDTR